MAPPRNTSLRYPGGWKALWGAIGLLTTYVLLYPVAMLQRSELLSDVTINPGGGIGERPITEYIDFTPLADWEFAGQLLFNSQLTPLSVPIRVFENTMGGMGTVNLITTAGGPYLVLLLVPAVVYAVTGMLATRNASNTIPSTRGYGGLMQFTGVLPLVLLAVFLFSFSAQTGGAGQTGSAGPSLMWGGILAGFVYPAIGGFVGGFVADKFSDSSEDTATTVDGWGS